MYRRNLGAYLRKGAVVFGLGAAVAILSNHPVNTLEQKLSQPSGMLESRVKSPETKEALHNRMEKEGWKFLMNYDPLSHYDEKSGLYWDREKPKAWFEIARELNIPADEGRVEQQAYDSQGGLLEGYVSVWIKAKK